MRIAIPGLNVLVSLTASPFWRLEIARQPAGARDPGDPSTYSGDGLTVRGRILDALRADRFRTAYTEGMRTPHRIGGGGDLQIHWRLYTCLWAAEYALALEGDFVECGVNTGIISRAVCEYVDFASLPREFFLFDTFEGIPESQATAAERDQVRSKNRRIYSECYEDARKTFAPFPNVRLVRGVVPESLTTISIDRVAYLSIDMNLVLPEIKALEFFWDRLVPGALVILDDYGFEGHRQQHDAIDAFAAERNVPVYSSPTGQGIIIRPPS